MIMRVNASRTVRCLASCIVLVFFGACEGGFLAADGDADDDLSFDGDVAPADGDADSDAAINDDSSIYRLDEPDCNGDSEGDGDTCDESSIDGGDDDNDITDVVERYIRTRCALLEHCQTTNGMFADSEEGCIDYFRDSIECVYPSRGYTINVEYGDACIDWMNENPCENTSLTGPCADFFSHSSFDEEEAAEGESCEERLCGDGTYCSFSEIGICPVCVEAAAENEYCGDPEYRLCDRGLYCNEWTDLCTRRAELNEWCAQSRECNYGLFCYRGLCTEPLPRDAPCDEDDDYSRYLVCREGKCRDRIATGEPCEVDESGNHDCLINLTCHRGTCEPYEVCVHGDIGQPCMSFFISECAAGAYCHPLLHECVPLLDVGESCSYNDECVEGAYCSYRPEANTCRRYAMLGESCIGESCIEGTYCAFGESYVCEERKSDGEECTYWNECQSSSYCSSEQRCTPQSPCIMPGT